MRIIMIVVGLFSGISSFAQACGQAVFTIEFYTINGGEKHEFKYEVLPVNQDSLDVVYSLYGFSDKFEYDAYYGTIIEERFVGKIIDYKTPEVQEDFENALSYSGNKIKGKVKNATLEFQTYETWYMPVLLKVSSGSADVYIVANLFGSCDRTSIVIWDDKPKVIPK